MDLNEYAITNNMSSREIAKIVQPCYPGLDRPLLSKARNPQRYGIRLVESAEKLLMDARPETPQKPRRADGHRYKRAIRCRVSQRKYDRVHRALKRSGYETIQSGMDALTDYYLKHPEILDKVRAAEGTVPVTL